MIGELLKEVGSKIVESFREIKPESKMTSKEADSFWKKEFAKEAELAKEKEVESRKGFSEKNHLENNSAEPNPVKNGGSETKRIDGRDLTSGELAEKDISKLAKDYIDDLKSKSEVPDTIKDDAIDVSKLEVVPSEEVVRMREEFTYTKAELRNEWERVNGKEWPRYEKDVVNPEGTVIRKAGDRYDAHHIQPLKLGGNNVVENITPLDIRNHNEIHSNMGSCNRLVEKAAGGAL